MDNTVEPLYYRHFETQNFWPLFAVIYRGFPLLEVESVAINQACSDQKFLSLLCQGFFYHVLNSGSLLREVPL